MTRTLARARAILADFAAAQDGWDGPDSYAAPRWSIQPAQAFLDDWPAHWPLPEPMIGRDGTVGFYWPDSPPAHLEVEFDAEGGASVYGRWLDRERGELTDGVPHAQLRACVGRHLATYFGVSAAGEVTGGG